MFHFKESANKTIYATIFSNSEFFFNEKNNQELEKKYSSSSEVRKKVTNSTFREKFES
jgi:hypothetical protein